MSSLSNYFRGSASKYLSGVDAGAVDKTGRSNQHEIGSNKFTAILGVPGADGRRFTATFLYFRAGSEDAESCVDRVNYYNSRRGKPRAPEYRLYYRDNPVSELMREGDFCLVALRTNGQLLIVFAPPGSDHERRLRYLFGVHGRASHWRVEPEPSRAELDLATSGMLAALGVEIFESAAHLLGIIVDRFGMKFPTTAAFSAFCRETCTAEVSSTDDPDGAIESWMRHEERLFRTLEKAIVERQLQKGFSNVDKFVAFSLSVQNRRKSRVGHALENHLEAIFRDNSVRYSRGALTEGKARPDFLFPGRNEYADQSVGSPPLRMLASKSTCKDRWRQILAEAARIPEKHLFTLETAISENQTAEMQMHRVALVVPPSVSKTYSAAQRAWLLSLQEFVALVKLKR